jgi:hypothetical protein
MPVNNLILSRIISDANPYHFFQIEFLQFNYDGNGSALVLEDGKFSYRNKADVHEILFGGIEKEKKFTKWFELSDKNYFQSIH